MRESTARRLACMTGEFYARTSASFAATRDAPWPGWGRVVTELADCRLPAGNLRLCDLACGNLRFERYLASCLGRGALLWGRVHVAAFDACDALAAMGDLAGTSVEVRYAHLDVVEALFAGESLPDALAVRDCQLAVCFGFMHHLALPGHRRAVLEALLAGVEPGGLVAVSFWQLSHSARLLSKARATTREAVVRLGLDDLGRGDYLLGWQDRSDVLRFCHDFSEAEVDGLAAAVGGQARELVRFSSDGATGDLNRYLVLQRQT